MFHITSFTTDENIASDLSCHTLFRRKVNDHLRHPLKTCRHLVLKVPVIVVIPRAERAAIMAGKLHVIVLCINVARYGNGDTLDVTPALNIALMY